MLNHVKSPKADIMQFFYFKKANKTAVCSFDVVWRAIY